MGIFDRFRRQPEVPARVAPLADVATVAALDRQLAEILDAAAARTLTQFRAFEAAETPHYLESWTGAAGGINQDLERALPMLRKRSRDLARNNDWARRFLFALRNNVLGASGVRLQMQFAKRSGDPNETVNALVEAGWKAWGKRGVCEVSRKLSWQDLERVALETLARDGEILIRKRRGLGPHGFQLQCLNPDVLDIGKNYAGPGNRIVMGVEIDDNGAPAAYWLRAALAGNPTDANSLISQRSVRVPASDIIHIFIAEEFDQVRGYPWLSCGARRLRLVKDYEEAAAVAASNAAKRAGFFISPTGEAPPGFADTIVSAALEAAKASGRTLSAQEISAITSAAAKYSTTVAGQFDTLPHGYDFKPFESKHPHQNHGEYVKECLRGFTAGQGISYVTGGNNLEAVNYSSAQVGILDERETFRCLQAYLASMLHEVVFAEWLQQAMLYYAKFAQLNPAWLDDLIEAAVWQGRRWPPLDPLKAANANTLNLANRTTSRRRIMIANGDDPDEVEAELAKEPPTPALASSGDPDDDGDDDNGSKPKRHLYLYKAQ
ncbi:phage portal protein [Hydrocarboniphaga sp.]|uniref:phage portal protein n=1 Tax=Hydrocarboniphaga sp. TaxID=2033016 RepID=UPI003D0D42D0